MKKLISMLLVLCLTSCFLSALAEEAETLPGTGYDFSFTAQLYPESFSAYPDERIQGYSDLLDSVRFEGSIAWSESREHFELNASVIPLDMNAGQIDFRIRGTEKLMLLNSNLLGEKTVVLNNYSLLAFCSKMSEHLGIPLQYLALMYPYSWIYCLGLPIQDWNYMIDATDENGVIPDKSVQYLWDCWHYRVACDEPLAILVDALCKNSDVEDEFRGFVEEIPDYFIRRVAGDQEIRIVKDGHKTEWLTASGPIWSEYDDGVSSKKELSLPRMQTGYLPVFSLETNREKDYSSHRLQVQLLGNEEKKDLVNLQASLIALPNKWLADCYFLLSLNLTGELLPNIGTSLIVSGQENGGFQAEFRKPTVDMTPGETMAKVWGSVVPKTGTVQIPLITEEEREEALDLFVSNDKDINAFVDGLVEPVLKGVLSFLIGIPTSSCETIMDDLSDLGVFAVLLGQ